MTHKFENQEFAYWKPRNEWKSKYLRKKHLMFINWDEMIYTSTNFVERVSMNIIASLNGYNRTYGDATEPDPGWK